MSTLVRWNPLREMTAMQSAMDRLFDDVWRNARPDGAGSMLALDVQDTGESYVVVADLPGLDTDKINVNVHDGILTIVADIEKQEVPEGTRILVQERPNGHFTRSINLPQPINNEKVDATYDDGVLKLTLPKVPEVQPRAITVKVGGKKK